MSAVQAETVANGRARRVLVVDDNEIVAALLCEALEHFGHTLEVARDGLGALELARDFEPEIVLLDVGLPWLNGCAVAERLRGGPNGKQLKLIGVSGFAGQAHTARALAAGFDHYFVKPVDLEALAAAIAG